jgi:UDP-N-acetylglucosamine 2-epimerase (non-hydrolysing)
MRKNINVIVVFGTRPEAIKLAPVISSLKKSKGFEVTVCSTGQHKEMLDQVLQLFNIKVDISLNVMRGNQGLAELTSEILKAMNVEFQKKKFDICIVHGDTSTAMSSSMAAFYNKCTIYHVEAGLRTNDKYSPWPEEINRQIISRIADFHYAPTALAMKSLISEGIDKDKIIVTGNTVIDSLIDIRDRLINCSYIESIFSIGYSKKILVTGHRRENFGEGFSNICNALIRIANEYPSLQIVYPVHLNPTVQDVVYKKLGSQLNIKLIEPLSYLNFVKAMSDCDLILTDSGGIQEEAPALGKPVLVMRDTTERLEAISAGVAKLVGTVEEDIFREVKNLIENNDEYLKMANAINPFGDGYAANRIRSHIEGVWDGQ